MKPKAYKCDLCGTTAVDHTQLGCDYNRQTMKLNSVPVTESKQIEKLKKMPLTFKNLGGTELEVLRDLVTDNRNKINEIIDHL